MAVSTGVDCIDNLVGNIEKASGLGLRLNRRKSRYTTTGIKDFRSYTPEYEHYYEVFTYINGRGEEAQIAIYYECNINPVNIAGGGSCEIHLLDILDTNDPRIKEFVKSNQEEIDYVFARHDNIKKILEKKLIETEEDAIREWKEGNIYTFLELAANNRAPCLIYFKEREIVHLSHERPVAEEDPFHIARTGLIITYILDLTDENLRKFIKHLMTSNAR